MRGAPPRWNLRGDGQVGGTHSYNEVFPVLGEESPLRLQGLAKLLKVAELWKTRKNRQVKEEREQNVPLDRERTRYLEKNPIPSG